MSYNNRITEVVLIIALLCSAAVGGYFMGANQDKTEPAKKVSYVIKPYSGVGSGVLKHGTLLDLTGRDNYETPGDIVGHIDAPGTWYMVRTETDD